MFPLGRVPTVLGADDPNPTTHLSGPSLSLLAGTGRLGLAALVAGVQLFGFAAVGVFLSTVRIEVGLAGLTQLSTDASLSLG